MKTMILRATVLVAALAAGIGFGVSARAQSAAETARQGAAKQEQIKGSSQKLAGELDAMIDEYQRNGLNGDEIRNLKSLKAVLARISDKDMDKIIALLRSASEPTDPKSTLTALAGAYTQQKGVMVQLRQILTAYAVDQEAAEIADSVRQLADRQAANLQAGIETAQWSLAGAKPAEGAIEASLQAQAAEEKSIAEEQKMLRDKLEAFSKKTTNKDVADRFKKGLDDLSKIAPTLDAATDALAGKKLFDAVGNEKIARDQLRQLARTIAPARENSELFREASETIDKLISQQKAILASTKATVPKTFDQWFGEESKKKNPPWAHLAKKPETADLLSLPPEKLMQQEPIKKIYASYVTSAKEPLSGLEDHEGDVANQADSLSQDLDKTAKPAAELLRSAIPPLQSARTALNTKEPEPAAKSEEEALAAMEKAKASIAQMLAAAEKAEALAGDKAAELREIQKQAKELKAQQEALAKATAAPKTPDQAAALAQKQAELQQQAAQLQQQAAEKAPAAADTMNKAAANMKQAADAMKNAAQAPQAQAQQQQAGQNLAKADQQLDQQIKQLDKAQENLDAAEKGLKDVAAIIAAQQKLQLETAQAAPTQDKKPDAVRALAPRQQGILADTEELKKSATTPDAQQPLASASRHMTSAQGSLEKSNAKLADPDQQKALADLFSIKNALDAQAQEAEKQLDKKDDQNAEAAQAASTVAQAQAQLDQAMKQMEKSDKSQDAAKSLADAAQKAAEAAAQANGLPPEANKAMQDAAKDAAKAASDAAAGQKQDAQSNAQKAQDALSKASNALDQAKAGIAGNTPPKGPSNQPPTPGKPSPGDEKGSQGDGGNAKAEGHASASKGRFLGLPKRDREAIQQAQGEKYPQQYAAKVEQYLQNLSDESSSRN